MTIAICLQTQKPHGPTMCENLIKANLIVLLFFFFFLSKCTDWNVIFWLINGWSARFLTFLSCVFLFWHFLCFWWEKKKRRITKIYIIYGLRRLLRVFVCCFEQKEEDEISKRRGDTKKQHKEHEFRLFFFPCRAWYVLKLSEWIGGVFRRDMVQWLCSLDWLFSYF